MAHSASGDTRPPTWIDEALREQETLFRSRGLAQRAGLGRTPALLVIDMQYGFTDPTFALGAPVEGIVGPIVRLAEAARAGGRPVIFSRCVWSTEAQVWSSKLPAQRDLTPGSRWVEIDARLEPADVDTVVTKHFASAFFATDLHQRLSSAGVDTLVVTGVSTSGCVRATVVDGCSLGYRMAVVQDAVADRVLTSHLVSLFDLDAKYGDVVTSDRMAAYLLGHEP